MHGQKDDMIVLLSNCHLALEKYQHERMFEAARQRCETGKDRDYPAWSERYVRDVVSAQSYRSAPQLAATVVAALPAQYVSAPAFDFGAHESEIDLLREMDRQDAARRARLNRALAKLLGNFGAHSRNAVRGILQAGQRHSGAAAEIVARPSPTGGNPLQSALTGVPADASTTHAD